MSRPRQPVCLELCAGEGGSTKGLLDAGWHVIANDRDHNRLKRNPAPEKYLGDWEDALDRWGGVVDLIWAGFPCQGYTAGTRAMRARGEHHKLPPRLIAYGRQALVDIGAPYVIENVEGAKSEMRNPILLCGRMFGLKATDTDGIPLVMDRHRLLESNLPIVAPDHPLHGDEWVGGSYGGARRDKYEAKYIRKGGYVPAKAVQEELLGIDWMTQQGLYLSIPPVYAEWVGRQIIETLEVAA